MAIFKEVQDKLLYHVWDISYQDGSDGHFSRRAIGSIVPLGVSEFIAQKAISALIDSDYLEYSYQNDEDEFEITASGIQYIENQLDTSWSEISKYAESLTPPNGMRNPRDSQQDEISWSPLKIDRSDEKYLNVLDTTEAALVAIRGDNGYASTQQEERNSIVHSIEVGLDHLKKYTPTKNQVISLILEPLRFIVKKFSETTIAEAAKLAVSALLRWLV